jgi:hypothetical protein
MMVSGANASDAAVRTIMALLGAPRQDGSAAASGAGLRAWEVSVGLAGLLLRLYLLAMLLAGMVRRQIEREVRREVALWHDVRQVPGQAMAARHAATSRSPWN